MAAPNIVNVTTITGKSNTCFANTSEQVIVSNPASSGQVFKINTVVATNVDGTSAADFNLVYNSAAGGAGSNSEILSTVSVPADASLVAIDKNTTFYLEENKSLLVSAGASGDIKVLVSYEEIS